jgi:hypothetical protein
MRVIAFVMLTALASSAASVQAQERTQERAQDRVQEKPRDAPDGAAAGGRYSFHRVGEQFIRLDTQTGAISQCGWQATGWSCGVVPDERAALDSEIARLQRDNAALKKALLDNKIALPGGMQPELAERKSDKSPDAVIRLPTDAELDQAMNFMKKVWRRLIEMMSELQRDMQRKT